MTRLRTRFGPVQCLNVPHRFRLYARDGVTDPNTYCIVVGRCKRTISRIEGESAAAFYERMLAVLSGFRAEYGQWAYSHEFVDIFAWELKMNKLISRRLADVEQEAEALKRSTAGRKPATELKKIAIEELFRIAEDRHNTSHAQRVRALCKLADIYGMTAKKLAEVTVSNYMVVPLLATIDDWNHAAEEAQMRLVEAHCDERVTQSSS